MSTEPNARYDANVKQDASMADGVDGLGQKPDDAQEKNSSPVAPQASSSPIENPFFLTSEGKSAKRKGLPEWLNHFNVRDLQMLFKASIAVWIFSLFMWINPTLQVFGQATFFGW